MANIKTTQEQWEKAKEYKLAGLSLSEIASKTGISKSSLGEKLKGIKPDDETGRLIVDAARVEVAKRTIPKRTLDVVNELVDERTKHIMFFNHVAIKNVSEAMELGCESQMDFRQRAETINKGRECVLGKVPDTAIQINNNDNKPSKIVFEVIHANAHKPTA